MHGRDARRIGLPRDACWQMLDVEMDYEKLKLRWLVRILQVWSSETKSLFEIYCCILFNVDLTMMMITGPSFFLSLSLFLFLSFASNIASGSAIVWFQNRLGTDTAMDRTRLQVAFCFSFLTLQHSFFGAASLLYHPPFVRSQIAALCSACEPTSSSSFHRSLHYSHFNSQKLVSACFPLNFRMLSMHCLSFLFSLSPPPSSSNLWSNVQDTSHANTQNDFQCNNHKEAALSKTNIIIIIYFVKNKNFLFNFLYICFIS